MEKLFAEKQEEEEIFGLHRWRAESLYSWRDSNKNKFFHVKYDFYRMTSSKQNHPNNKHPKHIN